MRIGLVFPMAISLIAASPLIAQRSGENERQAQSHDQPRANRGRIPAPPVRRAPAAEPEPEHREGGRMNSIPHVNNDR